MSVNMSTETAASLAEERDVANAPDRLPYVAPALREIMIGEATSATFSGVGADFGIYADS